MSHLAVTYNIIINQVICCAGHGKSIVDASNGIDKNIILRLTQRKVGHASDAVDKDNKNMKIHTVYDSDLDFVYHWPKEEGFSC